MRRRRQCRLHHHRQPQALWDITHRGDDGIAVFDSHPTRLDFLAAALFFSSPFMWAIISSAVLKGPYDGPFWHLSNRASMIGPPAGVYSSSAFGNWARSITNLGVITILPRWKAKLTRSPWDSPAWRRTLVDRKSEEHTFELQSLRHLV